MAEKPEVQAEQIAQSEPTTILHRVRHEAHPRLVPNLLSKHTIHVPRSDKPTYPYWVNPKNGLAHPRLECSGLTHYDRTQVGDWFLKGQKKGLVSAKTIYECLENTKDIAACLNIQDAVAFHREGLPFFLEFFGDNIPLFWGSVAQNRNTYKLYVPSLSKEDFKLSEEEYKRNGNWFPVESKCSVSNPAFYFK